ncbi:hypothetical protein [Ralstonia pseudosolanacearum]|uniref:hypothetical protein n=1 Tax=Ralstonia pseudosolanacearum TaxID=1310165 RepID=UPI001FF8FED0|nr:hypothetical protein [Ralstonia pseudosolanacearum]
MSIIDTLKSLASTDPIERAHATVNTLARRLSEARDQQQQMEQEHEALRVSLLAEGKDAEVEVSAQKIEQQGCKVRELSKALKSAEATLAKHVRAAGADAASAAWGAAEALLVKRAKAMRGVQDAMDKIGVELQKALDASEQAWSALPDPKPPYRPKTFRRQDLLAYMNRYLFGCTNGALGIGTNVFRAANAPDLIQIAEEDRLIILANRGATAPEGQA